MSDCASSHLASLHASAGPTTSPSQGTAASERWRGGCNGGGKANSKYPTLVRSPPHCPSPPPLKPCRPHCLFAGRVRSDGTHSSGAEGDEGQGPVGPLTNKLPPRSALISHTAAAAATPKRSCRRGKTKRALPALQLPPTLFLLFLGLIFREPTAAGLEWGPWMCAAGVCMHAATPSATGNRGCCNGVVALPVRDAVCPR